MSRNEFSPQSKQIEKPLRLQEMDYPMTGIILLAVIITVTSLLALWYGALFYMTCRNSLHELTTPADITKLDLECSRMECQRSQAPDEVLSGGETDYEIVNAYLYEIEPTMKALGRSRRLNRGETTPP